MTRQQEATERTGLEIAIIGMSGRFPGANSLEEFWNNLKQGVESISQFTDEELIESGVDPELLKQPNYVKAKPFIKDIELFDAKFFSYSPREAEITDPQIRILQETTWEALEISGYDPKSYPGQIGLYVGAATNFHWMERSPLLNSSSAAENSEAGTLCYKDAISTLTSYKLGLTGPSFTLYTACSTSLLGVHLASRALLTGECTMAVAGGVRVSYPTKSGYLYELGMTASPDGKVRAFDADAQGAIFGDGVGVVVLKRLKDAIADGDTIHAVIKGTAVNNDGGRKVGYTAPSVEGQAEVIRAAHSFAEVEPESISYIETHGTATPLGDTIEFEALRRAFSETESKGFCAIGSVKSNVGHLDTAAGVTGLIKTVLSLQHKQIPPTLHVNRPNSKLDLINSPFYLSTELEEWQTDGVYPRRAGVSAFGYGGTNVHLILEEAPEPETDALMCNRLLLVLSARSEAALQQAAVNLADHLELYPEANLADVAYTLQVGRRGFPVRRALVVANVVADAIAKLRGEENTGVDVRGISEFPDTLEQMLTQTVQDANGELAEAWRTGALHTRNADLLQTLGRLWEEGADVEWATLYGEERRLRIPLPTYPFEKQRYWLEPIEREAEKKRSGIVDKMPYMADWFYQPIWETKSLKRAAKTAPSTWLFFADEEGVAAKIATNLKAKGHQATLVYSGSVFLKQEGDVYTIDANQEADYQALLSALRTGGQMPHRIVHLWNVSREDHGLAFLDTGFYSLIDLAKAISGQNLIHDLDITVVSNEMQKILDGDIVRDAKQALLAPVKVLPQEYPNIRSRSIDIELTDIDQTVRELTEELLSDISDTVVAFRQNNRYISTFTQLPSEQIQGELNLGTNEASSRLRENGVYLITGGLGGVGLKLAEYLARSVRAKLVLIGRSGLPNRDELENYLRTHDEEDSIARRIRSVQHLEQLGAEVLVLGADVADIDQMREAFTTAEATFGPVNGVVHAAGILRVRSAQCAMSTITRVECEEQFRPKLQGLLTLEQLLIDRDLDFCFFVSSLSPILGGLGFVAYAGANLCLDAISDRLSRQTNNRWMSINWGDWQYTGRKFEKHVLGETLEILEMTPEEGIKTFQCVLAIEGLNRIIISSGDMHARYDQWIALESRGTRQPQAAPAASKRNKKQTKADTSAVTLTAEMEAEIIEIWKEFYRVSYVDVHDNFFDLGATSLDIIQIHGKLINRLEQHISIEAMFEHPTIRSLAKYLNGEEEQITLELDRPRNAGAVTGDIAIIGMAGRFPGAQDTDQYWENLVNSVDSIVTFTPEKLLEMGVPESDVFNPSYIPKKGYLAGTDLFDASFFDYTPRDAALMDPQLRVFHEVAWTALEHAGYDGETYPRLVGVYGGASPNLYWQVLSTLSESSEPAGQFLISLLNDKDSLTTQISYKFNLKGPSTNIFTGCSTSLVSIHTASQALLNGHCDMALAGGITLTLPDKAGYFYQEGMLFSADGKCKSFDEKANGMLFGDGVGVVVLKRLEDALVDGDTIHAVIKGSAINNDGNRKIGYTAPSVEGQAEVIKMAQQAAGVDADSVSYIETHGTATKLGDTIEIKALRQIFNPELKQVIPIGSVKSNIGHLNAASGAAGLIKTVLAMKHRQIPASLNCDEPNKSIDFENSPFFVNTELREWRSDNGPLRAGVSSFGIGGTNAHVVVEEAPDQGPTSTSRKQQMIMLSAKTHGSLDRMTANLAEYFRSHPETNLADTAYTLQVGRKPFKYRRALLASGTVEAAELLSNQAARGVHTWHIKDGRPKVVFLFAGNGSQYLNMGRDLYEEEPVFRDVMERCFTYLKTLTGDDFKSVLYPSSDSIEEAKQKLSKMETCQPLILSLEYALASLLEQWGVTPTSMIGYSFGEYMAACVAGVFTLEDALRLIVTRGRLMSSLPAGAMLSVPLEEADLLPMMDDYINNGGHQLSLSIVNGLSCIVAGSTEAIADFEKILRDKRLVCMRVTIEGAAHSHRLDPILEEFATHVRELDLQPPTLPYISCITGTWVTAEQVTDPEYWVRHMRETVRFADGIKELQQDPSCVYVEIGPGRDLSVMVQRFLDPKSAGARILNTTRPQTLEYSDVQYLLSQVNRLWTLGVLLDWDGFYEGETRRRIPLPTYSFEPVSYKPQGNPFDLSNRLTSAPKSAGKKSNLNEWFYTPQWNTTLMPVAQATEGGRWLLFADNCGLADALASELLRNQANVTIVRQGTTFAQVDDHTYRINLSEQGDYLTMLQQAGLPTRILHLWGVTEEESESTVAFAAQKQEEGFYSLFYLAQALSQLQVKDEITLRIITNGVQRVIGDEELVPEKAPLLGASLVLPQEYSYLSSSSVDIVLPRKGSRQERNLVEWMINEALADTADKAVAYRGLTRFVQSYVPLTIERPAEENIPLRAKGVYLITGGLGGIGLILAEHLARSTAGTLVLTSRSGMTERSEWERHLADETTHAVKIRKIQELEALGAVVDVQAVDVSDSDSMKQLIRHIEATHGALNGVIHGAGVIGGDTFNLIKELKKDDCEAHFKPKMYGLLVLEEVLRGKSLDFCLLMSSISAVLGGLGYAAYAASNIYMDAFVSRFNQEADLPWISVNWSDWKYWSDDSKDTQNGSSVHELSMTPEEGVDAFNRALTWRQGDLLVHSPGELSVRIDQWVNLQSLRDNEDDLDEDTSSFHARPTLMFDFVAPRSKVQEKLARIWQRIFRVEQVGVQDDFLELGGDSLKAITVVSRIHKEFNVEVPVADLFSLSNIEKLAAFIESADKSSYGDIEPVPVKDYYELSSAQKRFYILHRLHPESTAYNDTSVVMLQCKINKARLEQSFRELIDRHEIFRTTLEMVRDVPKQKIHEKVEFAVTYMKATEQEAQEKISEFVQPFDFNKPPYLRIALIQLEAEKHILVIDLHHIVTDGVSYDIFVREFLTLYAGGVLEPLRIQYKDYAEWQNSESEKEAVQCHKAFWLEQFSGELPVLNLPLDYPRQETQNFTGSTFNFTLDSALTTRIRNLTANEETTLYTVLLSAYSLLLSKYSGQEDIVVGSPITGRSHADLQNIIGVFVNMLAMRTRPRADMTFRTFMREVRDGALSAYEHQKYQYEDLVQALGLQGKLDRNPLFDVAFVLQNMNTEEMEVEGLKVSAYEYDHQRAQFDLLLRTTECEDNITMNMEYASSLFKHETIEKFCERFRDVLEQITEEADRKLSEIQLKHEIKELQPAVLASDLDDFDF